MNLHIAPPSVPSFSPLPPLTIQQDGSINPGSSDGSEDDIHSDGKQMEVDIQQEILEEDIEDDDDEEVLFNGIVLIAKPIHRNPKLSSYHHTPMPNLLPSPLHSSRTRPSDQQGWHYRPRPKSNPTRPENLPSLARSCRPLRHSRRRS